MRRGAGRARETGAADERGTGDGSARRCPCRRGVPRRSEAVCVRAQERLCEWWDAQQIRCCRVPASMLIIVYLHIASILSPLRTAMCTLSRGDGSRISQEKKTEQHRLSLSTRATLDNRAVANTHRPTWPIDTAPELCCWREVRPIASRRLGRKPLYHTRSLRLTLERAGGWKARAPTLCVLVSMHQTRVRRCD